MKRLVETVTPQRSLTMRQVRSEGTTPEVELRSALWARGLRYRTHSEKLPGKPDIVFPTPRVVVFIDGDYWHGIQWKHRGLTSLEEQFPATASRDYWLRKIRRNMRRDCEITSRLTKDGWTVIRLWESMISRDVDHCAEIVEKAIAGGIGPHSSPAIADKTVLEFFAGIGLMGMGLEKSGWKVLYANDIDAQKRDMFSHQFPDHAERYVCEDIHAQNADQIPTATLATASFPCNDLSVAGGGKGLTGAQSSAFWGFIRLLNEFGDRRPPLVLLENVLGFLSCKGGSEFHAALKALNDLGYAVDAFTLDAAFFVPQSRPRLFVVGVQSTDDDINPTPLIAEGTLRPKRLAAFIHAHQDLSWNIRALPEPTQTCRVLKSIVEDPPDDDENWWDCERAAYLLSQMSERHRAVADKMIESDQWKYGTIFRRVRNGKTAAELRTDGLAGCLRTPRGGSGRQILFRGGLGQYGVRLLSGRECARLMGAGDFVIHVRQNQALFGFGDAVCVPVIDWIATYYLNPLLAERLRGRPIRRHCSSGASG